jgi:hypothetical protein
MGTTYARHREPDLTFVKTHGEEKRRGWRNHQAVPWSNFPMILDIRRG